MAEEKFGIKETKEALHCLCLFAQAAIDSAADNKFGWGDIIRFIKVLPSLPQAIVGASQIGQELGDLSEAEKAELYAQVAAELKIPNEMVDQFVKEGFKVLLAMVDFMPLVAKKSSLK